MLVAKFRCENVRQEYGGEVVYLDAVYSDDPDDPNKQWSDATPFGRVELVISNPAAQGKFERGREYLMHIAEPEPVEPVGPAELDGQAGEQADDDADTAVHRDAPPPVAGGGRGARKARKEARRRR